jgi:hypothetical protein
LRIRLAPGVFFGAQRRKIEQVNNRAVETATATEVSDIAHSV